MIKGTIISAVKSSAGRKCRLVEERKGRFMHMEDTSEWRNAIQMKTIHYPRPRKFPSRLTSPILIVYSLKRELLSLERDFLITVQNG